jgi:hypothetical protein
MCVPCVDVVRVGGCGRAYVRCVCACRKNGAGRWVDLAPVDSATLLQGFVSGGHSLPARIHLSIILPHTPYIMKSSLQFLGISPVGHPLAAAIRLTGAQVLPNVWPYDVAAF